MTTPLPNPLPKHGSPEYFAACEAAAEDGGPLAVYELIAAVHTEQPEARNVNPPPSCPPTALKPTL